MLIRARETKQHLRLPGRRRHKLILALLVLVVWSGLMFSAGFAFLDFIRPSVQSLTGRASVASAVAALTGTPARWLASVVSAPEVEKLVLDIPFRSLHQIHEKRDEALSQGLLVTGPNDLVPGEMRHGQNTHRVRVRLKGDLPDHLETKKWSLRIQVRGGDAILGMRRFSLQAPETRGFQAEPLFLESLRDEGVLAPRYSFVEVVRNGKELGLMALEEHFSKELLESQERREGVILKFDESQFWDNYLLNGTHGPYENYKTATISAFQGNRIASNPVMASDYREASALLRAFVDGHLSASDVFDEKLLGRFLALAEIWGSTHVVRWHNLRLYFNPVDRKLEPIGFDANLQAHHTGRNLLTENEPICRRFLADERVRSEFVTALSRLTDQVLDGTLVTRWKEREKHYLKILNREYPIRAPIDFEPIVRRAEELKLLTDGALFGFGDAIHSADSRYPGIVHGRLIRSTGVDYLELANLLPVPVEVRNISIQIEGGGETGTSPETLDLNIVLNLPPTPLGDLPDNRRVELPVQPGEGRPFHVEGSAFITGQDRLYRFIAEPYPEAAAAAAVPNPAIEAVLAAHDMLLFDSESGMFHVGPGEFDVTRSLILPRDTGLRVEAGTTLRFGPDSAALVQGAVIMIGSETAPIILRPAGTGDAGWPGLLVLGDGASSELSHVQVAGTTGFHLNGWIMTGGLTFNESRVDLNHVSFLGTTAEDALNLVRSSFTMSDCTFEDTSSDAFDGDFSDGTMTGGVLQRIGGDGIDFSGSKIDVRGTVFRYVRDKAISVGEASVLSAEDLLIENAGTGLVSKDRSTTRIHNSRLNGIVYVGMMAYVKKPEYGPAVLYADNVEIHGTGDAALAQTGSMVVIDGSEIPTVDLDVDALYEQGYMKK